MERALEEVVPDPSLRANLSRTFERIALHMRNTGE